MAATSSKFDTPARGRCDRSASRRISSWFRDNLLVPGREMAKTLGLIGDIETVDPVGTLARRRAFWGKGSRAGAGRRDGSAMKEHGEDRRNPGAHDRPNHPVETLVDRGKPLVDRVEAKLHDLRQRVQPPIDAIQSIADLFEATFEVSHTDLKRVGTHGCPFRASSLHDGRVTAPHHAGELE
jgi:hypothetical protein